MVHESYLGNVLEDENLRVEFSNQGERTQQAPQRVYNPSKEERECRVDGCKETTDLMSGCCREHNEDRTKYVEHPVDWTTSIYDTESEERLDPPSFPDLMQAVLDWAGDDEEKTSVTDDLIEKAEEKISGQVPDATALQERVEGERDDIERPEEILEMIRQSVEEVLSGTDFGAKVDIDGIEAPVDIAFALVFGALVCEEINRGDEWFRKNDTGRNLSETPSSAGMYMSIGWYLYGRYTEASHKKIRMSMR